MKIIEKVYETSTGELVKDEKIAAVLELRILMKDCQGSPAIVEQMVAHKNEVIEYLKILDEE